MVSGLHGIYYLPLISFPNLQDLSGLRHQYRITLDIGDVTGYDRTNLSNYSYSFIKRMTDSV